LAAVVKKGAIVDSQQIHDQRPAYPRRILRGIYIDTALMKEVRAYTFSPGDFRAYVDPAHEHMVDALAYALYSGIDFASRPKKKWWRKALERFCRWLMDKLEIYEDA
jgi:hypothetical protein